MLTFQEAHVFVFRQVTLDQLSKTSLTAPGKGAQALEMAAILGVRVLELTINNGLFACRSAHGDEITVAVVQVGDQITVSSDAPAPPDLLTAAESTVLTAILRREELGVFFRPALRQQRLQQAAIAYGLEYESDLDRYLLPIFEAGRMTIQPRMAGLLPINSPKLLELGKRADELQQRQPDEVPSLAWTIVVIGRHKYYRSLRIELIDAKRSKSGKLKPPFNHIRPLDLISSAQGIDEVRFYAAVAKLQQLGDGSLASADFDALRILLKKGERYPFYYHDDQLGAHFSAKSLIPIKTAVAPATTCLSVEAAGSFYAITGSITIGDNVYGLHDLPIKFGCFFLLKDVLYLVDHPLLLSVMTLLKEHGGRLLVHSSKYREFRQQVLEKLSASIRIDYCGVKPGTAEQLAETGFSCAPQRMIYLSDFGNHVMIIPVVRYGEAEVAVRTEKQVPAIDRRGQDFMVPRDADFEQAFIASLIKQHPYLPEQLDNQLYYFYLPKQSFLDVDWFLPVFEAWREAGIDIYGFNELIGNKLSPHIISIDIKVISGVNWFNAVHDVRLGKKRVPLKKIQAALRNKSKYVALDDGTQGLLPQEWIARFAAYFEAGELADDDTIRFAKSNFETVASLYDAAMLDDTAASEIAALRDRLSDVQTIQPVEEPKSLKAKLRPYQQEGLNWLSFLDSLGFGGILADEMGLGKTVQIIAFMLSQRENGRSGTDLIVVPATLIFNWQRELATLAPSLQVLTLYGAGRARSTEAIGRHDVVLTSYATLLSDIRFLRNFTFNYVFLDESQNIKNPDSQRYRAVRLLKSRNRIAISGTPFENSSFDLYGQLSVVCPGLLGDKRYFRDVYAKPIDQFKNQKRRKELHRKIQPFILRRTKHEVAADLPEKVSAVLYCEMGDEQRKVYQAYEQEFRDFICALSGEELDKSPMHVLRGLTRLRQICNSPALLPDGMLNTAVSAKIELLKEQVRDKSTHHKLVIFSQFVAMLHLVGAMLSEIGVSYVSLTGATRQREQAVNAFQEDPTVRVFLVSLKAGGTGLNLTAAEVVYLVDPWWNPAVENQAIDRVHRIGQAKNVMAYRLVTPNTVEEKVLQLQAAKRALADGLVDNDASFFRSLDRTGLLELL